VVEDSQRKADRIRELVKRVLPDIAARVDIAADAASAGNALQQTRYDLMVLDVSLPIRQGESPRAEGGLEVLRAVRERKAYKRPIHIVGLSEYPELVAKHKKEFSTEMWYLVEYRDDSDEWAIQLGRKLIHIADTFSPRPSGNFETDLAIITALHKVELEAVLALPGEWGRHNYQGDATAYYEGVFQRGTNALKVTAAAASQLGMPAATALAMKVIAKYRPRYLAMVGISAGVKGNFGDVLVADQAWDYGAGKELSVDDATSAFNPSPTAIPLAPNLKSRFEVFGLDRSVVRDIEKGWEDARERGAPLQALIGPVASGAAVVAHRPIIDDLVTRNGKLIGVEMETYGVFVAAHQCPEPRPQAMSIKSICDFGNSTKGDDFQRYAANTSARYLYEFALTELVHSPTE
jgi:nucleoside phosphorylase/CheY-like chemotaxis protein